MTRAPMLLVAGLLTLAACGDDEPSPPPQEPARTTEAPATKISDASAKRGGTRITVRRSAFGPMIWGPGRQAIYIFQRDRRGMSRCYGDCAEAWPPVYTKGRPLAGRGVRRSLVGTTRRRDGRRQVTYDGKPLYYYAHEDAGEVRCHKVDLNGGLWWVIGPDGNRRP